MARERFVEEFQVRADFPGGIAVVNYEEVGSRFSYRLCLLVFCILVGSFDVISFLFFRTMGLNRIGF